MANLEESFHASVRENNRSAIEVLLKKGVNINCFYYGMTALHVAITKDHTDLAVWLIGQGADVNKSEINGRTNPFEEAVIRDQVQVIKCLAREGVNLNSQMGKGELGITFAAQKNLSKMLSALLGGKLGYIVVKTLAKQGVSVDQTLTSGHTALTLAATRKLTYLSQTLVDAGADVNLPNSRGETALWLSARDGYSGMVDLLVKAGADKNIHCGDQKFTPLLCSVVNEHLSTSKLLIQSGCDLNLCDSGGWTALWHAVSNSNELLVRALVSGGADTTIPDPDGRSLLEEATDNEDEDIVLVLKTGR